MKLLFRQLVIAIINGWPLILVFIMLGLFLGAFLPNRKSAAVALSLIFLASYLSESLANHVGSLAPLKPYSPFSYFDSSSDVFKTGVQATDVLTLLGTATMFFALTLFSFQRRNLFVGAWPWQRAKRRNNSAFFCLKHISRTSSIQSFMRPKTRFSASVS